MDTKFIERWTKIRAMKALGCKDAACAAELGKTTKAFAKRWSDLRKKYGW